MTTPSQEQQSTSPPLGRQKMFDTSFLVLAAITAGAAVGVAWLKGPWRVAEITAEYLGFLALLSPKILCGFFIAASLPILVPRETLTLWVGRDSGLRGLLIACFAGAVVPGGPMTIFPLAAGFRAAGASTAVTISFVTAWSLYGLNRTVIWEMSFLHIDFVLLRVLICLPLPLLVGLLARRVLP